MRYMYSIYAEPEIVRALAQVLFILILVLCVISRDITQFSQIPERNNLSYITHANTG